MASFFVSENQMYYVFGSARAGRACPWGLCWLSKQTYQEQVETGCHRCHIRPVLTQDKPQDAELLMQPGSCPTMPHACLIKQVQGTAEWQATGGVAAPISSVFLAARFLVLHGLIIKRESCTDYHFADIFGQKLFLESIWVHANTSDLIFQTVRLLPSRPSRAVFLYS